MKRNISPAVVSPRSGPSPIEGVPVVDREVADTLQVEVTLWDHERYADARDDPRARTIALTPEELLEFFGR